MKHFSRPVANYGFNAVETQHIHKIVIYINDLPVFVDDGTYSGERSENLSEKLL
jgi:hypothetical protein